MPLDMVTQNGIPLEIELEWARILKNQSNPLKLDDTVLEVTLKVAPPKKFAGGRHLGRYLVPITNIVFRPKDQPRDKSNDVNHVAGLSNRFELMGYDKGAQPMMGTMASCGNFVVNGFA